MVAWRGKISAAISHRRGLVMGRWLPESNFDREMKKEHASPVPSFTSLQAMSRDDLVAEYDSFSKPVKGFVPVTWLPQANFWLQEIARRDATESNTQMLGYTKEVTDMTAAMLGHTRDMKEMTATIKSLTIAITVLTVLTLIAAIVSVLVTVTH
jgi:hypothetical protein